MHMFLPKPHLLLLLLSIPKHHLLVLHLTKHLFQLQHQILLLLLLLKNHLLFFLLKQDLPLLFLLHPILAPPLPSLLAAPAALFSPSPIAPAASFAPFYPSDTPNWSGTHATSFLFFLLLLPKHPLLFLHLPLLKCRLLPFLPKHHFLLHLLLLLHPWLLLPLQNP